MSINGSMYTYARTAPSSGQRIGNFNHIGNTNEFLNSKVYKDQPKWEANFPTYRETSQNEVEQDQLITKVQEIAENYYKALTPADKGAYGDVIETNYHLNNKSLSVSCKLLKASYVLPKEAADIATIAMGYDEKGAFKVSMLAIIRKFDPGAGQFATPGGFRNITDVEINGQKTQVYDSVAFTVVHELHEEATLHFNSTIAMQELQTDYNRRTVEGTVSLNETTYPATLKVLRTIPTGSEPIAQGGETLAGGDRRVHTTTACALLINNVQDINNCFKKTEAADDAIGVPVVDLTRAAFLANNVDNARIAINELLKKQPFGIIHHREVLVDAVMAANKELPLLEKAKFFYQNFLQRAKL